MLAAQSGVQMEMLDPLDNIDDTVYEDGGNIQMVLGSSSSSPGWMAEMDEELKEEWNALIGGGDGATVSDAVEDAAVQMKNGKLINRESLQGVRVGSAGGWTLEVFPGDYVVHR